MSVSRAVGNDVVDLRDPETQSGASHPRFDARVFTAEERSAIARAGCARTARWCLWAAKEAAYKVARQQDPATRWSPRRFAVSLDANGLGVVRHDTVAVPVRVRATADWVHALATAPGSDPTSAALRHGVSERREHEDPSRAVRAALRAAIAADEPEALHVARRGRVPFAVHRGEAFELSFSHHGRFVAWATPGPAMGSAA